MPNDLQLAGNEPFEQAWYKAELIIFALMAAFIIAGLLGLFGSGWLSKVRTPLPGAAGVVEYERFLRNQGQSRIRIDIPASAGTNSTVRLDARFLAHMDVQATSPAPVRMTSDAGDVQYTFAGNAGRPTHLEFQLVPRGLGPFAASISVNGVPLAIRAILYP